MCLSFFFSVLGLMLVDSGRVATFQGLTGDSSTALTVEVRESSVAVVFFREVTAAGLGRCYACWCLGFGVLSLSLGILEYVFFTVGRVFGDWVLRLLMS